MDTLDPSNVVFATIFCLQVFKVLVAIPDERQNDRICVLMINDDKARNGVTGLMVFGEDLVNRYQYNDTYYSGIIERYAELIKDLREQRAVDNWMVKNKSRWAWMNEEPEMRSDASPPLPSRNEYSGRQGGGASQQQSTPSNLQNHSDSDANGAIHDSDDDALDDDDDSRFGPDDTVWDYMIVEGCGIPQVNGTYKRSGSADKVPKYLKNTLYDGKDEDFMIFRCLLSDLTRRWYISIVPRNIHPGTTKDIDFYAAPIPHERTTLPPKEGWTAVKGVSNADPSPRVYPSNTDVPYTA